MEAIGWGQREVCNKPNLKNTHTYTHTKKNKNKNNLGFHQIQMIQGPSAH